MVRVIPLFIHSMMRGEPITIYGGSDKTLDFTYVDDCIDGIVRGVEALAEGRVVNQTINLAYGEGNTLVRCAERIAAELGVEPNMTMAPSLLGEVTHYVADLSKARTLLGYSPKVALDEGIARAVAWFREHRAEHPEEDVTVIADHEGTAARCRRGVEAGHRVVARRVRICTLVALAGSAPPRGLGPRCDRFARTNDSSSTGGSGPAGGIPVPCDSRHASRQPPGQPPRYLRRQQ